MLPPGRGNQVLALMSTRPKSAPEIHRLCQRAEIVQAMQHDRQPDRVAAIADVPEPEADAEHLAEKELVILQMHPGPDQRRENDRARHAEERFRPAAVEEPAREQFFGDRSRNTERKHH